MDYEVALINTGLSVCLGRSVRQGEDPFCGGETMGLV